MLRRFRPPRMRVPVSGRALSAILTVALLAALLAPGGQTQAAPAGPATAGSPAQPADAPSFVVAGGVSDYALAAPKLFWHTDPLCAPSRPAGRPSSNPAEVITRKATYGSSERQLFYHEVPFYDPSCSNAKQVYSNIVADSGFVYWASGSGLVRLSTAANVGDVPALLSSSVAGYTQLAQDSANVYAITYDSSSNATIRKVRKSDGAAMPLYTVGAYATNLQSDGEFVYWLVGNALWRQSVAGGAAGTIATGVTGYYPEGTRTFFFCIPRGGCYSVTTKYVFLGKGNTVARYDNVANTTTNGIYTSSDVSASIYQLVTDQSNLFLFERHPIPCSPSPCFSSSGFDLVRTGRGPSTTWSVLYNGPTSISGNALDHLTTDNTYLYWQEAGGIQQLPDNAAALPRTNMRVTGIEVTQGVQDIYNSVRLIQNKRTFVRVYARSDGPAAVPNVTAYLYGSWTGGSAGPLSPVNTAGTRITVATAPSRNNLDDSFLFELPWNWTTKSDLRLQAVLNPYHIPPQTDYSNNSMSAGPFAFKPSPRLQVQFVSWGFSLGGATYYPSSSKDIPQTYSWIRRAYPLASTPGYSTDASPGFRPSTWYVYDAGLGAKVQYPTPCPSSGCDNLRASAYTNSKMGAMRAERGVGASTFLYGMISDASGYFPRGQACCAPNVSTGPAGSGTWGWDFDGSYADWYAGHEIGHTLGRAHPTPGSTECGQSASDPSYPYPLADIGPNDGRLEGFDPGDYSFGIGKAIYPGTTWHDLMSYCNNQWISDYTYNGMYDYMIAHPSGPASAASAPAFPQLAGDWLSVFGDIVPGSNSGHIYHLSRLSNVASIPPITPGGYTIQLVNGLGVQLASYPFTPDTVDDAEQPQLSFGQIVAFVPGTTAIRIVRLADNRVMTSQAISAHAPVVGGVGLVGAPAPVSGVVTLHWTASDADGDTLHFDVFYSRDGGQSFQPLQVNLAGSSTQIDTAALGGGSAILRVVASDGAQTAQADSAPFTMANKPPQVHIDLPADQVHVHFGQLVNFSGAAQDLQDGGVTGQNLTWIGPGGTLGSGPLLSLDSLPVGANKITLTAQNSANLSGSASITVIVDDDMSIAGPTLAAGPMQTGWHIAAGTTTPQTAQIAIGNSGGGTLQWDATSDAAWLTVSAATGSAPDTLTLTADPSGMADGTTRTAHVTLTAAGTSQSITIPVSLSVGNVEQHFTSGHPSTVYLPLVRR